MKCFTDYIWKSTFVSTYCSTYCKQIGTNTSYFGVDFDASVEYFKELHTIDPFMLENIDTYSNILYIQVMQHTFLTVRRTFRKLNTLFQLMFDM